MKQELGFEKNKTIIEHPGRNDCPTFRYPGGKALLAPAMIPFMPKRGRKFIDVFGGRMNILLRAIHEGLQFDEWIVNDIARAPFYRAVKEHGDTFRCTPRTREEFLRLKPLAKQGDVHALLMEPWLVFAGGIYDNGGAAYGGGRRTPESYERAMRLACEYLRKKDVRITQLDWLDCLEAEGLGADDFVIVDGPYVGCDVGAYGCDSLSHLELVSYLTGATHPWLLCEYKEPFYCLAFGEPIMEKKVQLRQSNVRTTEGATRLECLWSSRNVVKGSPRA